MNTGLEEVLKDFEITFMSARSSQLKKGRVIRRFKITGHIGTDPFQSRGVLLIYDSHTVVVEKKSEIQLTIQGVVDPKEPTGQHLRCVVVSLFDFAVASLRLY